MEPHHYPFKSNGLYEFTFTSIGPKGKIRKKVWYEFDHDKGMYLELRFGDDVGFDKPDVDAISDNSDRDVVLRTVALTVVVMLKRFPELAVRGTGSNEARVRLYHILIGKHHNKISAIVSVHGKRKNRWSPFKRGVRYTEFQATLKCYEKKYET